jgi:mannose-6-phosphate isomerase-like protein (cupin superfamily)
VWTVVTSATRTPLTWAKGEMSARLDLENLQSPRAYFGRLSGTLPVAEHDHAGSWEILLAKEGRGTFTIAGREQRLEAGQVVYVPPGVKHSWKPDAGTRLIAAQVYVPPGPEQRFRKLADEAK